MEPVRLDKWLWAVRLYKTRSLATDACRRGHILVNGMPAKASREVKTGDSITVRKLPVIYNYIIKELVEKRLPAKLVSQYIEDQTTPEELAKLTIKDVFFVRRNRGTGRPTKKERRQIEDLKDKLES